MKKRLTAFLLAAVVSAGICSMQAVIGPAPGPGALETVTVLKKCCLHRAEFP